MATKTFKVGDMVRHTSEFRRSIGLYKGHIDGMVIQVGGKGSLGSFPVVVWSEGNVSPINPVNIEIAKAAQEKLTPELRAVLVREGQRKFAAQIAKQEAEDAAYWASPAGQVAKAKLNTKRANPRSATAPKAQGSWYYGQGMGTNKGALLVFKSSKSHALGDNGVYHRTGPFKTKQAATRDAEKLAGSIVGQIRVKNPIEKTPIKALKGWSGYTVFGKKVYRCPSNAGVSVQQKPSGWILFVGGDHFGPYTSAKRAIERFEAGLFVPGSGGATGNPRKTKNPRPPECPAHGHAFLVETVPRGAGHISILKVARSATAPAKGYRVEYGGHLLGFAKKLTEARKIAASVSKKSNPDRDTPISALLWYGKGGSQPWRVYRATDGRVFLTYAGSSAPRGSRVQTGKAYTSLEGIRVPKAVREAFAQHRGT